MKVKLYNLNTVTDIIDCNDINRIYNPRYFDDVVVVEKRDHTKILADDVVFMLEGEEECGKLPTTQSKDLKKKDICNITQQTH